MPSDNYVSTGQQRNLRACMICSIVKHKNDFVNYGCPNCDDVLPPHLRMRGNADNMQDCTSQVFEGFCFVAQPSRSWVARWQRLDGNVEGMYAVKVVGNLPEAYIDAIDDAGKTFVPRDGSGQDEEA